MPSNQNPPSIRETAFECPHCGAYTTQYWSKLCARRLRDEKPTPHVPSVEDEARILRNIEMEEMRSEVRDWLSKIRTGLVFVEECESNYYKSEVHNLHLSQCYNCDKFAVWVHDGLIFPAQKPEVSPNIDLPSDVVYDFEEARCIVATSPRGAAALLRLCVQKLCRHLGESGKNIDADIASLVAKGLNPLIQQSLDIVRVIGNEAVHPGTIDLRDDRDTASRLFCLINSIADQMISHPKHVQTLYLKLPEEKRKAIEDRNEKAKNKVAQKAV